MRDVAHKQLLGVRVADHPPALRLALLHLSHWNRGQRVKQKDDSDDTQTSVACEAPDLASVLCVEAGALQASAPGAGGPSGVSVCCSGTLASPPPAPGTENETQFNQLQDLGGGQRVKERRRGLPVLLAQL